MKDDLVERCARAFIDALDDGYGDPYIGDDAELSSITIDGTCDIPKAVSAVLAIARPAILEEAAKVAARHDAKPCGHASGWSEDQRQLYDVGQIDASTSIAATIRALSTTGQEGGR